MDGSIDISIQKQNICMVYHGHCHFNALVKPDAPLYNIEHSNGGLITFPEVCKNNAGEVD
jgi:hypothetical protein